MVRTAPGQAEGAAPGSIVLFSFVFFLIPLLSWPCRAATEVSTLGTPFSIPPSQYWDGDDGPWSTFGIQLGTPSQNIRVLPGSGQASTTVVDAQICKDTPDPTCLNSRGGTYNSSASSSYEYQGLYTVALYWEDHLGYAANATYGYDNITLGWQGSGAPQVSHQVLGAIQTKRFFDIGTLALNPRPVNFTGFNDPHEALLHALRHNSSTPIPSTTWSYTAGAYNQVPKSFGNLVLGGYDTTYFEPNDITFPFYSDISTDLMVYVQNISTNATSKPLMGSYIFALIDTLIAEMWLPVDACSLFEEAFGLTWDNSSNLYPINDTLHQILLDKNPSVYLNIAPNKTGGSVEIEMPYWSLYLSATSPRVTNDTRYFPLRRATDDTQYTLGRAFLQAAHISADYDRLSFNVSKALFPASDSQPNVVAVLPPVTITDNNNGTGTNGSSGGSGKALGTGAIAGIAVGAAAVIIAIALAFFLTYRRRRKQQKKDEFDPRFDKAELDASETKGGLLGPHGELDGDDPSRHELTGDVVPKIELDAEAKAAAEMDGEQHHPIYEMAADDIILPELPTPETDRPDKSASVTPLAAAITPRTTGSLTPRSPSARSPPPQSPPTPRSLSSPRSPPTPHTAGSETLLPSPPSPHPRSPRSQFGIGSPVSEPLSPPPPFSPGPPPFSPGGEPRSPVPEKSPIARKPVGR